MNFIFISRWEKMPKKRKAGMWIGAAVVILSLIHILERARLVTESYRQTEVEPYMLRRAKAVSYTHLDVYKRQIWS